MKLKYVEGDRFFCRTIGQSYVVDEVHDDYYTVTWDDGAYSYYDEWVLISDFNVFRRGMYVEVEPNFGYQRTLVDEDSMVEYELVSKVTYYLRSLETGDYLDATPGRLAELKDKKLT